MKKLLIIAVLGLVGCSNMSQQKVAYVQDDKFYDALGRNAQFAGIPLCSDVTLARGVKECRVR